MKPTFFDFGIIGTDAERLIAGLAPEVVDVRRSVLWLGVLVAIGVGDRSSSQDIDCGSSLGPEASAVSCNSSPQVLTCLTSGFRILLLVYSRSPEVPRLCGLEPAYTVPSIA
ncbi:hypothetical protein FO519_008503 [Halicephalobus sp. NKZ332]|nr:hypothetical protein FO519_008503 [Halicephalobus sp. NKZ332]